MASLDTLKMYGRFVFGLPRYLRNEITLEQAQEAIRQGLAERENGFLRILRRSIYENPGSPYLPLLRQAGFDYDDVEALVRTHGLEGALDKLRAAGVRYTFEEFKGRAPVVRNGETIEVDEHDFDNPLTAKAYEGRTGGSTSGVGSRVETDLDNLLSQVPHLMLARHANGLLGLPMAVWYGSFPDPTGVGIFLRAVVFRRIPERWFTPVTRDRFKPALKDRLATEYVLLATRLCGVACPRPEALPLERADILARWAADAVQKHGGCEIVTTVSLAVRVCLAAREAGLDLTGTKFLGGGEPFTPAKNAVLQSVGAGYASLYIAEDTGPMGIHCLNPLEEGDQHLLEDNVAIIQHPREVPGSGVEVDAFYITTLRHTASKVLLNVESDDFGIIEERTCGCPLEELGYTRHVRRIRSFGKLTGEGVTLVGSDMVRILEEVLPARFGGSPQDFQLLEREDEHGISRLSLLISPHLQIDRNDDVIEAIHQALGATSVAADLARMFWEQADTIRIERRDPIWTARGKFIPIRVAGLHDRDSTARPAP